LANDLSATTFVSGNANVVNDTFRTGSWNFYVANTISANSITGSSASTEWTSGSLLSAQYVFDGTLVNGATLVVDAGSRVPGNPYLKFNNPTYNTSPYQYAQFTPVSIPSGGISFSMWVKHTTLVANTYPIYFSIRGNGNNLEMGLANPTPEWYVIVGGAVIKVDGTVSTITNGNWHHLVWTISASGMFNMYLDGSLRKTQQSTYPTTGLRTAYNIGTYNNTGDPNYLINGGIDNFKLFTRELTALEVTAEYNNNTTNLQFMLMTDSGSAPKWRIKPAIPVDTTETNYTVKSNEIALTPGTNSTYAVWTAPKTTRIVIDVSFADYHSMSAGVGFQMFKINANNSFGSVIFPRTVTSTALTNAASTNYLSVPSSTISVNAGDKIYYRIDANGNPTSASSVLATTISTETTIQENIGVITTNLSATDSSMNTIRTNLSSYILSNDASLSAIRTSIQQVSSTGSIQDPSINDLILYNSNQDTSINTIRTTVSGFSTTYYTKTDIDASINSNVYNKTTIDGSINSILSSYAQASSLTSYYTKTDIDASINSNVYNKTTIDGSINSVLSNYAQTSSLTSYYTKTDIDASINSNVYNKTTIDGSINSILSSYAQASSLTSYYNKTSIDSSINDNVYNKTTIDGSINSILSSYALASSLTSYYDKTSIDASINDNVYNKTTIDGSINSILSSYALASSLTSYYTKTDIDSSINNVLLNYSQGIKYQVTNSGSGAYVINSVNNQTITLIRGLTYVFSINASGHPFWIQTSDGEYSSSNIYNTGITNNGTQNENITWVISNDAPNTLYYVCQYHSSMQGTINIIDLSFATAATVSNSLSSYYIKSDIDSSINSILTTTYSTMSYVDNRFTTLIGTVSTDKLDTLAEIALAIQGDASFGINVYQRLDTVDSSINTIRTSLANYTLKSAVDASLANYALTSALSSYATTASLSSYTLKSTVDASLALYSTKSVIDASLANYALTSALSSYATTASLSSYATRSVIDASLALYSTRSIIDASLANYVLTSSLGSSLQSGSSSDVSLNGNIQLGNGSKNIQINKSAISSYSLDVSGSVYVSNNLDMSGSINATGIFNNGDVFDSASDGLSTHIYSSFLNVETQITVPNIAQCQQVMTSGDGKYITLVSYTNGVSVSSNYGATFTDISNVVGNVNKWGAVMSDTGQYQYLPAFMGASWKTTNYGNTWVSDNLGSYAAGVSGSGRYVIKYSNGFGINISSNFGETYTGLGLSATNVGLGAAGIAISKTGQIMMISATTFMGKISNNFGRTWRDLPFVTNAIAKIAMSASGKYILAGNALSNNFGVSFEALPAPANIANNGVTGLNMSPNGQYMFISNSSTAFYSRDYGKTWVSRATNGGTANTAGCGNGCVAMPSNASYVLIGTSNGLFKYNSFTETDVSINTDVTFSGNVQIGTTRTQFLGINKAPSTAFALDVSGSTNMSGNLTLAKRTTDISYAYFDLSAVNMSVFNVAEKFTTVAFSQTPTLDYRTGGIFYMAAVSGALTNISITNVPTTLNRSISVTLILAQNGGAGTNCFTTGVLNVNSIAIAYVKPDATALAAPSANRSVIINQFIIIWATSTPTVIAYLSSMG
jgi:hypothetical protein